MCISAFIFVSCEDELGKDVEFNVSANTPDNIWDKDTLVVNAGDTIDFHFSGNPDIISFYSGEAGHEYAMRNMTEYPADEIISELAFSTMPQYGIIPGTLKVYLSTTFTGLLGNDKKADSLAIIKEGVWTDISDLCNLPTETNQTKQAKVSLQEYLGKQLTIAFLYETEINTSTQPTWVITDLQVVNIMKTGGSSAIRAGNLGFTPFDMYNQKTPYTNGTGSGVWNLSNISAATSTMRIQSSPSGNPLNQDWLICNPFKINKRIPDTAVGVKSMPNNMEDYSYAYKKKGTYTVDFMASRVNYEHSSETVRELYIRVE